MKKRLALFLLFLVAIFLVVGAVHAQTFENPIEPETVDDLITRALEALQGVIVALSVVFIIIGAIIYITSSGNESRVGMAKKAITASMIGLAIGVAAPSFVLEIYDILEAEAPADITGPSLAEIIYNVLEFLLSIVGVLGIIMLVFGGISYLTAGGDQGRADTAKKIIKYSIIGIVIALSALIIVRQIGIIFSGA